VNITITAQCSNPIRNAKLPRFRVIWGCNGDNVSTFWTDYHAAQYIRALTLNNTPCRLEVLP
jgi:hypothetical protein